ncbi:hypothetical protein ACWENS_28225 [Streptomyces sp. NPDC004532]
MSRSLGRRDGIGQQIFQGGEGAGVFQALLRKPAFAWERDGEELLRRRRAKHFAHEPLPSVTPVGNRLAELLRMQGKKR